jgi:hypothetical protein
MLLRHLTKVHALLAVLDEPTPEMAALRSHLMLDFVSLGGV